MRILNKKILPIMLIVFLIIICFTVHCYAYSISQFDPKGVSVKGSEALTDFGNVLITVITTIGVVASVVILIILGIKYMLGSIEEKAQYKKSMMPYLIGSVVVFSASTIANIIYNWVK